MLDKAKQNSSNKIKNTSFELNNEKIKNNETINDKIFIASVCPAIVNLILIKYPEYKNNLINVVSPVVATSLICKKYFKDHIPVFISPCFAKKVECKQFNIPYVVTFNELKQIIDELSKNDLFSKFNSEFKQNSNSKMFDKFYNDYTKIYPLAGALSKTMHAKELLSKNQVFCYDGFDAVEKINDKKNKNVIFYDLLFCKGGCIGGPAINSQEDLSIKSKKLYKYLDNSKKEKIGKSKGKVFFVDDINFSRKF